MCLCALAGRRESAAQIMSERNAADRQTDPLTVGIICLFLFIRAGGPRLTARMCGGPRAARPGGSGGARGAPAAHIVDPQTLKCRSCERAKNFSKGRNAFERVAAGLPCGFRRARVGPFGL